MFGKITSALGFQGFATMLAVFALTGLGLVSCLVDKFGNYSTEQQNIGAQQCIQEVSAAEFKKLQAKFAETIVEISRAQSRAAQLTAQIAADRASAQSQITEIKAATANISCTIPDKAVDAINAPLRARP